MWPTSPIASMQYRDTYYFITESYLLQCKLRPVPTKQNESSTTLLQARIQPASASTREEFAPALLSLECSRLEHFATGDGARIIYGFQQRAAAAAVEGQDAIVVGHAPLHVVQGGAAHASVLLHALRCHALVVRAQLVPPDVVARRRKVRPVHEVPVAVADEGVQVEAGAVEPALPVPADAGQKPLRAHLDAAAAHCKATTLQCHSPIPTSNHKDPKES
jgi:hypothetical protein